MHMEGYNFFFQIIFGNKNYVIYLYWLLRLLTHKFKKNPDAIDVRIFFMRWNRHE